MFSRAAWRSATGARSILWASTHFPQARPLRPIPCHFPRPSIRNYSSSGPTRHRYSPRSSSSSGQQTSHGPFNRLLYILSLWRTSPPFRYGVTATGAGAGIFYITHLETVPGSGRRRFNWVSPRLEREMAKSSFQEVLSQYKGKVLPEWAPETRMVERVMERLIPNSGVSDGEQWEVRVVRDGVANAFVMPGNKVFVFTGILPICQNEDGLATVLGHEIAHNVAHHSAESFSRWTVFILSAWALDFATGLGSFGPLTIDLAYNKPGSRVQESEADYLGLLMMARSCFDPEEAVKLWQRMEVHMRQQGLSVPQFLSTHPADRNRIAKMAQWLPEARQARDMSECGWATGFVDPFREAANQLR